MSTGTIVAIVIANVVIAVAVAFAFGKARSRTKDLKSRGVEDRQQNHSAIFDARRAFEPPDVGSRVLEHDVGGSRHLGYIANTSRTRVRHSNGDRLCVCRNAEQDHERGSDRARFPQYSGAQWQRFSQPRSFARALGRSVSTHRLDGRQDAPSRRFGPLQFMSRFPKRQRGRRGFRLASRVPRH